MKASAKSPEARYASAAALSLAAFLAAAVGVSLSHENLVSSWPNKPGNARVASLDSAFSLGARAHKSVTYSPRQVHVARVSSTQTLAILASASNSRAELLLGLKYLNGDGVPVNEAEAARWLTRAAQQGEALAQYRLGTLYERGRGLPADREQAAHWYELAARQGNRKAMHNLAVAYAEGADGTTDYARAAIWFGKAALLGFADSQFNLGVLYERGMGVKQSLLEAYKWYAIAAAQGDAESKARLGLLASRLNPADRAAAQTAAAAFKPQQPNAAANADPTLG